MTNVKRMKVEIKKRIECGILMLVLLMGNGLKAQDIVPEVAVCDRNSEKVFPSKAMRQLMSLVEVENPMPSAFCSTRENSIYDPTASLDSFFEKLGKINRPIRIVHIGDSHVRGHIFPYEVRRLLEEDFGDEAVLNMKVDYRTSGIAHETGKPGIVYHIVGINGATCASYNTPERIKEIVDLKPDLIISSFGTNEAHCRGYRRTEHLDQMKSLLTTLRLRCPEASVLMTTPPGAYMRYGRKKIVNTRTPLVVETERAFSKENKIALWDMYDIVGGAEYACKNWASANMFQRDKIHFTADGYKLMGSLLHEAFIKAYNNYVEANFN